MLPGGGLGPGPGEEQGETDMITWIMRAAGQRGVHLTARGRNAGMLQTWDRVCEVDGCTIGRQPPVRKVPLPPFPKALSRVSCTYISPPRGNILLRHALGKEITHGAGVTSRSQSWGSASPGLPPLPPQPALPLTLCPPISGDVGVPVAGWVEVIITRVIPSAVLARPPNTHVLTVLNGRLVCSLPMGSLGAGAWLRVCTPPPQGWMPHLQAGHSRVKVRSAQPHCLPLNILSAEMLPRLGAKPHRTLGS